MRGGARARLPLPSGKMAVTVETGAPEQVAGYVQYGSRVAIFLTYNVVATDGGKTSIERTRILLPRVEVLAVGTHQSAQTRSATNTSATAPRTGSLMLTVAVDLADAERLIEGRSHGTLYLGLLIDSVEGETRHGRGQHRRRRGQRTAVQMTENRMTILYEPNRRDAQQFAVLLGDVQTA